MHKPAFLFLILGVFLHTAASSASESESLAQLRSNAQTFETEQCDIVVHDGICLYQGDKLLFGDAKPEGLAGYWSFDDFRGMDYSGNHMHINQPLTSGPGFGPHGYSARIGANDYIVVPPGIELENNVFSVSFWFFLSRIEFEDPQAMTGWRYCPLLYKGSSIYPSENSKEEIRSPAIFLDRKDRLLRVHLSKLVNDEKVEGETIVSNSRITYNKWTHITVVKLENRVKLYINGILDSVANTEGSSFASDTPLYIGNHPDYIDHCDISGYVDELRFYKRALKEIEIQAEASPALGNGQAGYVQLGCINCPLNIARSVCAEGYHLCTTIELHSQAFQVAKTMGWLEWNSKIWTYAAAQKDLAANPPAPATTATEESATNSTETATGNEAVNATTENSTPQDLGIGICCAN